MRPLLLKIMPGLLTIGVFGAVLLAYATSRPGQTNLLTRMEWALYDLRVRLAYDSSATNQIATNLACVYLDDATISEVSRTLSLGPVPPRFLYGYVLDELAAQQARAVAMDVWFSSPSHDCEEMRRKILFGLGRSEFSSDEYLARSLGRNPAAILSAPGERDNRGKLAAILPLLRTNAVAVGHTASERDGDGTFRRVPLFTQDAAGSRVWTLGVVLAAQELGLDLAGAEVTVGRRVRLQSTNATAVVRDIPLADDGTMLIDWRFLGNERGLHQDGCWNVVQAARERGQGKPRPATFTNKLVLIGSIAHGNNMADRGTTPLLRNGYLMHTHVNVANTVISGWFPRRASSATELALISGLTLAAGLVSWRWRVGTATAAVLFLALAHCGAAYWAWKEHRYWLPVALPVGGALLTTYVVLSVYRAVFERAELRRIRTSLHRFLAPDVMQLVLEMPTAPLHGVHREVTVMFADLRGFTEFIDARHQATQAEILRLQLPPETAQALTADAAREALETVNRYLGAMADTIKRHGGTLDKYIGDCVMAFWGAPVADQAHAAKAVRAALDVQTILADLNTQRRETNSIRATTGLPALPILEAGISLNTGVVTVGFMGSDQHISNYTVFGREVNIAARLEGVTPGGNIRITAATHAALLFTHPDLAAACRPLPPAQLRGISAPVEIFAVEPIALR